MSVKYSWSRQNGAAVPPVRFMSIEPAEDYYKGMPLKLKEKGIVEPTDGDPEYICMAQYDPDAEIQPLEIPVQEVFPDVVYDRMNEDGTTEEVRFGSKGGGGAILDSNGKLKSEVLPEGYPYDAGGFSYTNSVYKDGDELIDDAIFRVSEDTPSYEDLLGANFAVNMAGNVEGILTSEMVLEYVEGKLLVIELLFNRLIIVVYEDNLVMDGEQIPYTKKGVYMMKPLEDGVGIYSISKTTIVPIASEFLPKITIVQDGYNNAAAGVSTMATSESYTCTANATYAEVLQALQNKNVPTTELYYHGQGNGVIGVAKGGATYLHVETDGNLYIRQEFYINGGHLLVVWGANGEIGLTPNI